MTYDFISNSEIEGINAPEKFYVYATSYLNSAILLNQNIIANKDERHWGSSAVVLHLSAHAMELFLKFAIYTHSIDSEIEHHDIEELYDQYNGIYNDSTHKLHMPFLTEHILLSSETIEEERKKSKRTISTRSVRYRYPMKTVKKEWHSTEAFEPSWFLQTLDQMKSDFSRIRDRIT